MNTVVTPKQVAEWMVEELERENYLYQERVLGEIANRFGQEFIRINENGNPVIHRRVLEEFRKLTESTVVWERGEGRWRWREGHDALSRNQD